jgi:hypothetical protein
VLTYSTYKSTGSVSSGIVPSDSTGHKSSEKSSTVRTDSLGARSGGRTLEKPNPGCLLVVVRILVVDSRSGTTYMLICMFELFCLVGHNKLNLEGNMLFS